MLKVFIRCATFNGFSLVLQVLDCIFVHDSAIGGNGASRALYDRLEKAFERSLHIVKECPCKNEAGCPRCTFSYRCGNNNEYLHKLAAAEVLQRINDGETTETSQPVEGDKPLV